MKQQVLGLAGLILLATAACKKETNPTPPPTPTTPATPVITWKKTWGGTLRDEFFASVVTADGGLLTGGATASTDGDITTTHGNTDLQLVKYDAAGNKLWQRLYGGSSYERLQTIIATPDGGYIAGGNTASRNGDVTGPNGSNNLWVMKLDAAGAIQWQQVLGGTDYDEAKSISIAPDGGYVVTGTTQSNDGPTGPVKGRGDILVLKLSATGTPLWEKAFGTSNFDQPGGAVVLNDGSIYIGGYAGAADGDAATGHIGGDDFWLIKLDAAGTLQWKKQYGGSNHDVCKGISRTADGQLLLAGYTQSNDGDITRQQGNGDIWLLKLDLNGTKLWQKSYGGSGYDVAHTLALAPDGGFFIAGQTDSRDGDTGSAFEGTDAVLLRLDANGSIQWKKTSGGNSVDYFYHVAVLSNTRCMVAGSSSSNTGDLTGISKGDMDAWLLRVDFQ